MKILHVIPSVSDHTGGPAHAIFPMCRALADMGNRVQLGTTDADLNNASPQPRDRFIEFKGVSTIFFPSQFGRSFKYSRPFANWLYSHAGDYDVVHIHAVFNHACIVAASASRRNNVPYIIRPLGSLDPWSMKQKSLRKTVFWHGSVKKMMLRAAGVHYTSVAEQHAVESSLGLNSGFVLPLGVETDDEAIAPLAAELDDLRTRPYVLVLSRLHPKKAVDLLIEAFLTAVEDRDLREWRLVIAGDGSPNYVSTLKQLVAARGGQQLVKFPGWLGGDQKTTYLSNAALLALPSRHENFGLCVAEAMAHAVPVMVSPEVNLSEDIRKFNCGWVAPLEKDEMASTLATAMRDEYGRAERGRAGQALAKSRFAWPSIARELLNRYEVVINK